MRTVSELDKKIGAKVKELRILSGHSQDDLGRHLGVTFQQVQKYETGSNRVSVSTVIEMAEKFQCPVADMLENLGSCEIDYTKAKGSIALQKSFNKMSKQKAKLLLQIAKEFAEG